MQEEESQWRDWWEEASVNMESILMCRIQNVKTVSEHPQYI